MDDTLLYRMENFGEEAKLYTIYYNCVECRGCRMYDVKFNTKKLTWKKFFTLVKMTYGTENNNGASRRNKRKNKRNIKVTKNLYNCHHFIISNDLASGKHFIYNYVGRGVLDRMTFISINNLIVGLTNNYCHKDSSFFVFTFRELLSFEKYTHMYTHCIAKNKRNVKTTRCS